MRYWQHFDGVYRLRDELGGMWFERHDEESGEWVEENEQFLRVLEGETDWDEIDEDTALRLI